MIMLLHLLAAFLQCSGATEFTPIAVIQGFVMGSRGQGCPDEMQIVRRIEDCQYALEMFTKNRPDKANVKQYYEDSNNYQVGCSLHLGKTGIYNDFHEFSSDAPTFFYSSADSYPVCYEEGIIPDGDEGIRIEYEHWTSDCYWFTPYDCPSGYQYYRDNFVRIDFSDCIWGTLSRECRRLRHVCATGTLHRGRNVNGIQAYQCIRQTNFGEFNDWSPIPMGYEHIFEGCVNGQNIVLYHDKSTHECAELCNADENCLAFEYGVAHGGSRTNYIPRDCQLQSSADSSGCDGTIHNLDLYVKAPAFEVTSGSQYCHVDGDCITDGADLYTNYESCSIVVLDQGNLRVFDWDVESHHRCDYDSFSVSSRRKLMFHGEQTIDPTIDPSVDPTMIPTSNPSQRPTICPSMNPIEDPTNDPTTSTTLLHPTTDPSLDPTIIPTTSPSQCPTVFPSMSPSSDPTSDPTMSTSLLDPTVHPLFDPTKSPTSSPSRRSTINPSKNPSEDPTKDPTMSTILLDPTLDPSLDPTMNPTTSPSQRPTMFPSMNPSSDPTRDPTMSTSLLDPTIDPSVDPTMIPTSNPSQRPTICPSMNPVEDPTIADSEEAAAEDQKFCGRHTPEGMFVQPGNEIFWNTDYSVTGGGWKVCLERTGSRSTQGQIPCDSPQCIGERRSLSTQGRKY